MKTNLNFETLKRLDSVLDTLVFGRPLGMLGEKITDSKNEIKDEAEFGRRVESIKDSIESARGFLDSLESGLDTLGSLVSQDDDESTEEEYDGLIGEEFHVLHNVGPMTDLMSAKPVYDLKGVSLKVMSHPYVKVLKTGDRIKMIQAETVYGQHNRYEIPYENYTDFVEEL